MKTGEPVLDAAAREYRRSGNIDIFNNMITFAFDSRTWREIGCPRELTWDLYAMSPFAAAVHTIGSELINERKHK